MFTGIVQGVALVVSVESLSGLVRLGVELPEGREAPDAGASISINGVCLTVTGTKGRIAHFDVIQESLDRTTLGTLTRGSNVNVERSLRFGDEVGGHTLSGHVDCRATVTESAEFENNKELTLKVPSAYMKYILPKGYIGLDGASLTVKATNSSAHTFSVALIPETLKRTTFGSAKVGRVVNVEIDRTTQAIVDTVERVLAARTS